MIEPSCTCDYCRGEAEKMQKGEVVYQSITESNIRRIIREEITASKGTSRYTVGPCTSSISRSAGCVCPAGAEATCKGVQCPRQGFSGNELFHRAPQP